MKKIIALTIAALFAVIGCVGQAVEGVVYRPQTLLSIDAVRYDTLFLLYTGEEVVVECHSLTDDEQLTSQAIQTVLNAVASMAFQFTTGSCTLIVPKQSDYPRRLYNTYTFAAAFENNALTIDFENVNIFTLTANSDGTVQLRLGLYTLKALGLIDDTEPILSPFECDDILLSVDMPHDGSSTLYRYILPAPFAMRRLATTGVFGIFDEVHDSSITALFPTTELMDYVLTQDEGIAVVMVGTSGSCTPCERFNDTVFLPAVEEWLAVENVVSRVIVAYVDIGVDSQQVEMLSEVVGKVDSYPAVYFIRGGKQVAPAIVGCADDALTQLIGILN
ncbi:MAG: hypothetical protein SOZ00_08170 [Tidjanibacter sp.]|nr:hypothetical protein [Tidjanibacter sp.]